MIKIKYSTKLGIVLFFLGVLLSVSACTQKEEEKVVSGNNKVFIDVTKKSMLKRMADSYAHCWGDINNDGFQDLFIINHITRPTLFRNNGDGTFKDITSYSGMKRGGDLHGCAIADYDNDGDEDIYITLGAGRGNGTGLNRLYQNQGGEKFKDVALEAGVTDPKGRGRSASWVDYNNDGFLDLFVANNKRYDAPAVLFENKGDGKFINVSAESGLDIVDHIAEANWIDYDGDGLMDLTVVHNMEHLKGEITIYKNKGDGTFRKTQTFDGRSYGWGDYDNDGDMDILTTSPPRVHFLKYEIDIISRFFKGYIKLYENNGEGQFIDVSGKSGFEGQMGGEKAVFFDYDNDGDLDIYLVVGGTKNKNINDIFFNNNGDGTFTNATKIIGMNQDFGGRGCGVAFADYNNDGFLDLFLTNGRSKEPYVSGKETGPYVLYENTRKSNHWLKIKLSGIKSNRDGIGARVRLQNGSHIQYRQNNGGMEGYIQNSSIIHFGLGDVAVVDGIEIMWPGGISTNLSNINADQILSIKER